jgi:hypothetical protein
MQPVRIVLQGIGWLALAVTLLLTSPGVQVVRAEDARLAESADTAKVCSLHEGPEVEVRRVEIELNVDANSEIIGLNNSGYSYRPSPVDFSEFDGAEPRGAR